ncbi:MAG: threonine synthase [Candidatus Marinimicrobia bacterium]|nr:threonine synthase [Candidatus Neomarinimicrobiota bacterium]
MKFYSTKNKSLRVSLKEAILTGMPPDNGLYMPLSLPKVDDSFLASLSSLSLPEIAFDLAKFFVDEEIDDNDLRTLVEDAFSFDAPLVSLSNSLYSLELFHGPTLAFKDFGARFMSRLMAVFTRDLSKPLKIFVATSGDTGSAVANGFYDVPGIHVYVLYPEGKVSEIQEKQLATLGKNITALRVKGVFDDCQALVKQALADERLRQSYLVSSANSINIARLIPQTFYYFRGWAQLKDKEKDRCVISVPSGNLGNLTAGLMAKRMGLPIQRFVDAANINDVVPEYLHTGIFIPRPSKHTLSSAMDVGNPSNFDRILDLYHHRYEAITQDIWGKGYTDDETKEKIRETYEKYGYLCDPHGAVGLLGLEEYLSLVKTKPAGIFLETAHPAKFKSIVEDIIQREIPIPERLAQCLNKPLQAITIENDYRQLLDIVCKQV